MPLRVIRCYQQKLHFNIYGFCAGGSELIFVSVMQTVDSDAASKQPGSAAMISPSAVNYN